MSSMFPTLPNLPPYLASETYQTILARMLAPLKAQGIDTAEGSLAYDVLSPVALELAQAKSDMREYLKRGFARYSFGPYLEHIAEQRPGIERLAAVAAVTTLRFTGVAGTPVGQGVRVSTQLPQGATEPAVEFRTNIAAVIGGAGYVDVLATCTGAGPGGNVAQGALKVLLSPLAGVTGVTNPYAVGDGPGDLKGVDEESDVQLLVRYLQVIQNPPGSGSQTDYPTWVGAVPGVGGVYVDPRAYGPNTVRLVLVGEDLLPATAGLVEAVEDHLYAPHRISRTGAQLSLSGYGYSTDGDDAVLAYNAVGPGTAKLRLDTIPLPVAGVWRVFLSLAADSLVGNTDLMDIGVYSLTAGTWSVTTRNGTEQARLMLSASDLTTDPGEHEIEFYWNGVHQVEFRVTRLQTDTTTTVHIGQCRLVSTIQDKAKEPAAPCTDRFYVESAVAVPINVSYHPTYAVGADPAVVQATVAANLEAYLQLLTMGDDNDVRYVRVGSVILDTPGIVDYTDLLVNGQANANVPVGPDEVAVLGTVTVT